MTSDVCMLTRFSAFVAGDLNGGLVVRRLIKVGTVFVRSYMNLTASR
jgi:hypothetical protein